MKKKNIFQPKPVVTMLYLLPGIILFSFVFIFPIFFALYSGFFNFYSITNMEFVGWKHYLRIFNDKIFWTSFAHNMYLVFGCLVGQIGIAFLLANLINSRLIKIPGFYRIISFFPVTLAAIVTGFVWGMLYDYNYGLINVLLRNSGLGQYAQNWLGMNDLVMTFVNVPMIWQYVGLHLVIILAAMTSIDKEIIEVAELDGVSGFQRAVKIIAPMIKNTLIVCVVLCIAGNLRAFDHIYAMTGGGPGYSSMVMALYAYDISFNQMNLGYGSALSFGILVLGLVVVLSIRKILDYIGKEKGVEM